MQPRTRSESVHFCFIGQKYCKIVDGTTNEKTNIIINITCFENITTIILQKVIGPQLSKSNFFNLFLFFLSLMGSMHAMHCKALVLVPSHNQKKKVLS